MRFDNDKMLRSVLVVLGTLLLGGSSARASDVPKDKGVSAPAAPPSASPATGTTEVGTNAASRSSGGAVEEVGLLDYAPGMKRKWFDIGASWETHGLLWQNNTNAGQRKFFNFAYAYASLNLTKN